MIRNISKVLTVLCGLAVLASVAVAGVPDATTSTTDGDLDIANARGAALLTSTNLRPTIVNGYQVTVRDIGGTPLAGVTVQMQFAGSGIQVHSTQTGGQVAVCGANTLSLVTNASGQVNFFPAAMGLNSSAAPNVQVRASGVLLTTINFRSVDMVSAGPTKIAKVDIADLGQFRSRYGGTDLACDYASEGTSGGKVDVADLNIFRAEYLCGQTGGAPAPCTQTECP